MDSKTVKQRPKGETSAFHVWLIMLKALSAIARRLDVDMQRSGVTKTDFPVIEAVLHRCILN